MKSFWWHPAIAAGLAIMAVLTFVLGRVALEARTELAAAKAYDEEGRITLAIEHYRRTIRWAFPLSPYTAEAISVLESLAERLEAGGDRPGALSTWRSLSGGLAASRFLYSGSHPARENANDQIARLLATDQSAAIDANLSVKQLATDHRRLLSEPVSPDPWWGALLLLGMSVWVGALAVMARRGFDSAGRFDWASARGPLWGAFVGFVSFALGLLFA